MRGTPSIVLSFGMTATTANTDLGAFHRDFMQSEFTPVTTRLLGLFRILGSPQQSLDKENRTRSSLAIGSPRIARQRDSNHQHMGT